MLLAPFLFRIDVSGKHERRQKEKQYKTNINFPAVHIFTR